MFAINPTQLQSSALPTELRKVVWRRFWLDHIGIEPMTLCMLSTRAANCARDPFEKKSKESIWPASDLNTQPQDLESYALPIVLASRNQFLLSRNNTHTLSTGIEPVTLRLTATRSANWANQAWVDRYMSYIYPKYHTERGARTHDHKIKSLALCQTELDRRDNRGERKKTSSVAGNWTRITSVKATYANHYTTTEWG